MWKVKRMNTARIVVLTPAVGAGGIVAYLATGSGNRPLPTGQPAQPQTADVPVANSDINFGPPITPEDLLWQSWPAVPRHGERVNAVRYGVSSTTATQK
jgi:pilus assembly protein CpaB